MMALTSSPNRHRIAPQYWYCTQCGVSYCTEKERKKRRREEQSLKCVNLFVGLHTLNRKKTIKEQTK